LVALHPDDVERVRSAWQAALALGTDYHTEQRVRGRDGRYRRFVSHGVPVKDAQGRPVEWFGTDSDVEDRRQAEEAQHRLQAELAHVARVTTLGEMAASIAHEINQPLAAMVANGHACAHWLEATPPKLGEVAAIVRHMVRDANRAAEVIQRIRSFLQRGGGSGRPSTSPRWSPRWWRWRKPKSGPGTCPCESSRPRAAAGVG